jgi:formylglycine-generating enzyme required for sulfatase activity
MGEPQPGDEFLNAKDGSILVWIPGGEFIMGRDDGPEDEKPAHKQVVQGLWMGRYEVTNAQYTKFMQGQPVRPPMFWEDANYNQPDQPVVGVTWMEAKAYCDWAAVRMPTECEWEYAAAGGKQLKYPTATGEISHDLANFRGTGGRDKWEYTSPVGSFPANPFGLYDMAGNGWDFTFTRFAAYPYSATDGREVDQRGSLRELRGGCWFYPAEYCLTTQRHRFASHLRYDYSSIRVALSKAEAAAPAK